MRVMMSVYTVEVIALVITLEIADPMVLGALTGAAATTTVSDVRFP